MKNKIFKTVSLFLATFLLTAIGLSEFLNYEVEEAQAATYYIRNQTECEAFNLSGVSGSWWAVWGSTTKGNCTVTGSLNVGSNTIETGNEVRFVFEGSSFQIGNGGHFNQNTTTSWGTFQLDSTGSNNYSYGTMTFRMKADFNAPFTNHGNINFHNITNNVFTTTAAFTNHGTIYNGLQAKIYSTFNNYGTIDNNRFFFVAGYVFGSTYLAGNFTNYSGATFNNQEYLYAGAQFTNQSGAVVNNYDELLFSYGNYPTSSDFENYGTINNHSGARIKGDKLNAKFFNYSTVNNSSNVELVNSSYLENRGTFQHYGSFSCSGASALNVGTFNLHCGSSLTCSIGGTTNACDNDGDGVGNSSDLCGSTPAGQSVDSNGCADSQVDGDGDGICNPGAPSGGPSGCTGSDNCPSTSNPGQQDTDGDGEGNACDTNPPNVPGAPTVTLGSLTVVIDENANHSSTEYLIQETSSPGGPYYVQANGSLSSSPEVWQTYTNWGGATGVTVPANLENTKYTFQVKARDPSHNESAYSPNTSKYTHINEPTGLSFSEADTNITMTAQGTLPNIAADGSGLSFKNTNTGPGATDSGWIQTLSYQDTSLTPDTEYSYNVKARNGNGDVEGETDYTSVETTRTLASVPGNPTVNSPQVSSLDVTLSAADTSYGPDQNPNTVTYAIRINSSLYLQAGGGQAPAEAWQTAAAWGTTTVTNLDENQAYNFQVKARNSESDETGFSGTTVGYTAVDVPTNFQITPVSTSFSMTVDSFVRDTTPSSGAYFEESGGANSGWLSPITAWISDLLPGEFGWTNPTVMSPNTGHVHSVRYRNIDSVETVPVSSATIYTLANTPVAPTVELVYGEAPPPTTHVPGIPLAYATSVGGPALSDSLKVTINNDGNPANTLYLIQETSTGHYVQWDSDNDGPLGTDPYNNWKTYAEWGGSSGFIVTGLLENTEYTFQVKAKNTDGVETPYSTNASLFTMIEAPTDLSLIESDTSVFMTALGSLPNLNLGTSGLYFFNTNSGPGGDDYGWTSSTTDETYTDNGLTPDTVYQYQVMARNGNGVQTTYTSFNEVRTLASRPGSPTVDLPLPSSLRVTIDQNGNPATVVYTIYEETTHNYVQANGSLSGAEHWLNYAQWGGSGGMIINGLSENTGYNFQIKAKNSDAVETSFSVPTAAYTGVDAPTNFQITSFNTTEMNFEVDHFPGENTPNSGTCFYEDPYNCLSSLDYTSGWLSGGVTWLNPGLLVNTEYTHYVQQRNADAVVNPADVHLTIYTEANIPDAPTVELHYPGGGSVFSLPGIPQAYAGPQVGPSTNSLRVTINTNGNPSSTQYFIEEFFNSPGGLYVQANGTLGASPVWQTYSQWGGSSGIVVTGLSENTEYRFRVKARNGNNVATGYSQNTALYTAIAAPAGLSLSSVTNHYILLTASGTLPNLGLGLSGVFFQNTNSAPGATDSGWVANNSFGDGSLTPDTQYSYRVKARNGDGVETVYFGPQSDYTLASIPGTPLVDNEFLTYMDVTLDPSDNPSNTEFAIYETSTNQYVQANGTLAGGGEVWQQYSAWGGASGITVNGLATGVMYTFQVKAINENNVITAYSSSASGITQANKPGAPTVDMPTVVSCRVIIDENGNPGFIEYLIQESTTGFYVQANGNLGPGQIWQTASVWHGGLGGALVSGLSENNQYTFHVKARTPGPIVETAYSDSTSLFTLIVPPTGLTYTDVQNNQLSMTAEGTLPNLIAGLSGLYFNNLAGPGASSSGLTKTNSYTDTGLSVNEQYTYQAMAQNGDAELTAPAQSQIFTLANTPGNPTVNNPQPLSLDVTINDPNGNPAHTEYAVEISQGMTTLGYVGSGGASIGGGETWQTASVWGTITVSNLDENQTYSFRLKARNGDNVETNWSNPTAAYTAVDTPTNFQITSILDTEMAFSVDSVPRDTEGDTATFFEEQGTANNSGWLTAIYTWINDHTGAGLIPDTFYTHTVKHRNADATTIGVETIQVPLSAYTRASVPGKPILHIPATTTTTIAVSIDEVLNPNTTRYLIREKSTGKYIQGGGSLDTGEVWQTASAWGTVTATGLVNNNQYSFDMRAMAQDGAKTAYSVSSDLLYTLINTPTSLDINTVTTNSVWMSTPDDFSNLGADSSAVSFEETLGNAGASSSGWITALNYQDAGLSPNILYTYQVKARNGDSTETAATNPVAVYTLADVPGEPSLQFVQAKTINVTIDENGNSPATEYVIEIIQDNKTLGYVQTDRSIDSNESWNTAATWGNPVIVTGTSDSESYSFQVKARNGDLVETVYSERAELIRRNRPITGGGFSFGGGSTGGGTHGAADGEGGDGQDSDTGEGSGGEQEGEDDYGQGGSDFSSFHGSDDNEVRKRFIKSMTTLFAWMHSNNYQLTSRGQKQADRYQNIFLNKIVILLLGQIEQPDSEALHELFQNLDNNEKVNVVSEFLKTIILSFNDCFTPEQIQRATSHDTPENGWWWAGYWHFLQAVLEEFLGDQNYELWDPVTNWDILGFIDLYLETSCGDTDL